VGGAASNGGGESGPRGLRLRFPIDPAVEWLRSRIPIEFSDSAFLATATQAKMSCADSVAEERDGTR
jgi:hypothetical protein